MCNLDDLILEHLEKEDWSTANLIEKATTMNASERRASERLRMLSKAGLVGPIVEGSDVYELTAEGQRYLEGDLDADLLARPNPRAV